MKIVLFAREGIASTTFLKEIGSDHEIVAFVTPPPKTFRGRIRRALLSRISASRISASGKDLPALVDRLTPLHADLICIVGFPYILPPEVLAVARLGALNVHPSLLPRHRGPMPLFWIYHCDDRETGVTVHVAGPHPDSGPIVSQTRFPLPRGMKVAALSAQKSREGGLLLSNAVAKLAGGVLQSEPQDEAAATAAPVVHPGQAMVDFARWDVERTWHFLQGLHPYFSEPLVDDSGRRVRYGDVGRYEEKSHDIRPGSVARKSSGWILYCRDGIIHLTR